MSEATVLAVGDVILTKADPDRFFALAACVLHADDAAYKDKPIFPRPGQLRHAESVAFYRSHRKQQPECLAWPKRRKKLFGFEPDPNMPNYAFHPESRSTVIAKVGVSRDAIVSAGFVPCSIDQPVRPVPLSREKGG